MTRLVLTNTLTGSKEPVLSSANNTITLYVCGITPYDYAHVGHGRCYVTFDLLVRVLTLLNGYTVTYCRNFTDIDDKLLARADKEFGDQHRYHEIANRYITAYQEDVARLGCLTPTYEPRVTDNIPSIIEFVAGLIERNLAYVSNGSVYYRVRSFPNYGALSRRKLEDLKVGARVAVDTDKEDPLDFALWKAEPEGQFWQSPWSWGRPGWHIECSALAQKYLGITIDIHGGGMDLIFPHHENEIAQSEGRFGVTFARQWVHNAFVRIDQEKMSKSLGNFFTLRQIFEKVDPTILRYYILTHHYRSPLDFSWDDLAAAAKSYNKLCKIFAGYAEICLRRAGTYPCTPGASNPSPEASLWRGLEGQGAPHKSHPIVARMIQFLCDDLNTQGMLGLVFEHAAELAADEQLAAVVYELLHDVLGLPLVPIVEKAVEITPEIQLLLDERLAARDRRDWKRADELRDKLRDLGVEIQDKKL